jgi:hypothetical protein
MSQPTSLSAGSALGQQTCLVKYNINLSACSAPGRQTCRLAHEDFYFKELGYWQKGDVGIYQGDHIGRIFAYWAASMPES